MTRLDPRWALVGVLPARMALDALWWVELPPAVPLSAGQLGSALLLLVCGAFLAARPRAVVRHPLRWPALLWTLAVAAAALHSPLSATSAAWVGHLLTPVVWVLALGAWGAPARTADVWLGSGGAMVGLGLVALVAGQPADHVLHGWPRLLGPYANVHTHAGVMAVVAVVAVTDRARPWARAVAVGALVCLLATFVRTAWLSATVAGIAWLWARDGGRRPALAGSVAIASAFALIACGSGRFAAEVATLGGGGDVGQLGSSRVRIWFDSTERFLARGPGAWLGGLGLGAHGGLHRHLDPHSEVLAVWFQAGLVGLVAWLAWVGSALHVAWRRATVSAPRPGAALAFALLAGAAATSPLSNDWLTRATVSLWTWGCLGLVAAPAGRSTPPPA